MFKFIFVYSILFSTNIWALPKASTIYNEYIKVFASHNTKYLKEEFYNKSPIFRGGCDFELGLEPAKAPCNKKTISKRVEGFPASNKIFHLKLYSVCRKLVADERELAFFKKKFSLEGLTLKGVQRVHQYFYAFGEKDEAIDKVWLNIEGLEENKGVSALFMTYCIDPGWL